MRYPGALLTLALPAVLALSTGCGGSADSAKKSAPATTTTSASPAATPNGVENLDAKELLDKAIKTSRAAASVHITSETLEDGDTVKVDARISQQTATVHMTDGSEIFDLTRIGDSVYLKANKAALKELGVKNYATLLDDNHLLLPQTDRRLKGLREMAYLPSVIDGLATPEAKPVKGTVGPTPVGRAVYVDDTDTTPKKGGVWKRIFVAVDGEPRILQTTKYPTDHTEFSYGEPVTATAPPKDKIVDPRALQQKK